MNTDIEELEYCRTPLGELVLRRRRDPVLKQDIYEVKLNDDFLMSSAFTAAERELAVSGLRELEHAELDILVGGLGLGYTAQAVLEDPRVRTVTVVETLSDVIDWHRRGLVPLGRYLAEEPRCRLVHDDFYAVIAARGTDGAEPSAPLYHAVLLDIDHSPRHLLHTDHAAFYREDGLRRLPDHLHPGGLFAMWSNDPPEAAFMDTLGAVFATADSRVVSFHNPYQHRKSSATIYIARAECS